MITHLAPNPALGDRRYSGYLLNGLTCSSARCFLYSGGTAPNAAANCPALTYTPPLVRHTSMSLCMNNIKDNTAQQQQEQQPYNKAQQQAGDRSLTHSHTHTPYGRLPLEPHRSCVPNLPT